MAQLKDLIVSGPTRLLNDLYVQNSIQVTTGIKIGSANELKSFGTGLSINSSGVLSCTVAGTITGSGTNGYLTKWNGGSSITNGPQLGSDTTKFLNNAGGWTVPAGTTYSFSAPLSKNNSNAVSLTISTGLTMNNNALTIDSGWFDDALADAYSVGVGLSKSQTTFSLDTMFGAEFIVGTQTAATGSWTGVTKRTALYDGMQIAYWLPYAGSGNATLNLTLAGGGTTGAVNCYYNGTSRLTTHYGAGNLVHLTYRSNVNIGGTNYTGWWSNANYDSNDYDSLREYYAQPRVDANSDFDLYMYQLLLTTKSGTVVPYSNGHNAPGTFTKTMTTDAFDPFAPIYRWSVSWDRTEAKGAIIPTGYLYTAVQLADVRYFWNIDSGGTAGTTSLTANQPIYIKAKYTRTTHTAVLVPISGSTNYLERSSIVQTLPSSNPNGTLAATETYIYIFLGYAYDKYRMVLYEQKPIYCWDPNTNSMGIFSESVYSSKSAASGGTAVSLVTTGEKYTWNNKISNPMTAANDIIIGGTNGAAMRLGKGSNGTFLGINSNGNVAWVDNPIPFNGDNDSDVLMWDGTTEEPYWITPPWLEQLIFNAGEIIIGSSNGNPIALSKGSTGQVLTTTGSGNRVAWQNATVRMNANSGSTALSVLLAPSDVSNGASKEAQYANASGKQLKFAPSTGDLSGVAKLNGHTIGELAFVSGEDGVDDGGYLQFTGANTYAWATPPNTNTWRAIKVGGTQRLDNTVNSNNFINFTGSGSVSVTWNSSTKTINIYGSQTCLIEGTKILMANGAEKNIEDIERGDVIMSYDPNTGHTCEAVVLACDNTGTSDDFVNYFFDNGSMLTIFGKHCIYNKEIGTAKDCSKWTIGNTGIDYHGEDVMFVGTEDLAYAGRKRHYDLRSSNMLYFANGILNAESLTWNYSRHKDDDLPESFKIAMKADFDSSANLHKHQFTRGYGTELAPVIKEIRRQEKIIADNKKLLADSDYIVQKFTEGLIGAIEWAKAKANRSSWRDLVNTAEAALSTAKSRMSEVKKKYKTSETRQTRFNAAVARDNACLDDLKAHFAKQKSEK